MMTRPRSGFAVHVRVRFVECDPLGHVNNAVYLHYLEQAAIDHAAAAGWPAARQRSELGAVFVARRHDLTFLQPAFEGDVLAVRTWPVAIAGGRATRAYSIHRVEAGAGVALTGDLVDGDTVQIEDRTSLIVRARTEWAFVSLGSRRPVRIPPMLIHDFLEEAGGE